MDPDQLEELRKALTAHRRGVSLSRVDSIVNERTDFDSLRSFVQAARDQGVPREELERDLPPPRSAAPSPETEPDRGLFAGMSRVGRLAGDVATFGLLDEGAAALRGGVHALGALVPGGRSPGEAFREESQAELAASRERFRKAQEGAGTGTKALGFLGGLLGPGAAAGKFVTKGAGAAARAGRGALAGGVEGGLFGFGSAEGSPAERLPETLRGAGIGAAAGAAIPASIDAARVAGRAVKATSKAAKKAGGTLKEGARGLNRLEEVEELERTIGPRLGGKMREGAGIEGRPSRVRSEISEARKGIFGALDEIDEIPDEGLQKALRLDDVKPFVPDEVAAGKRAPSFPEAQGALRQVRKAKGAAMRSGDAASVKSLSEAERAIGSRLSDAVEGLDEANAAYAEHMARARALEAGGKMAPKSADDVREAFDALGSDVERQAFRESLGHWFLKRLDDHTAIPTTLKKIRTAPETRAKLKVLFGDNEEAFNAFVDAARKAERTRNRAKAGRLVERELIRQLPKALPWIGGAGIGGAGAALLSN